MATPRLPFLYPSLMRAVRSCEPRTYRSLRFSYPSHRFHTSRRWDREGYQKRYGPAVEPRGSPSSRTKKGTLDEVSDETPAEDEALSASEQGEVSPEESQSDPPPQEKEEHTAETEKSDSSSTPALDEQEEVETQKDNPPTDREAHEEFGKDLDTPEKEAAPASSTPSEEPSEDKPDSPPFTNQTPFDDVLHMPSPSVYLTPSGEPSSSSDDRPPHLSPAPYVHHFDTYSLVQDLSKGGFSHQHSTTIMKGVRAILQNNLDMAKESLTSKSDVENEEYLFKAACSELQSSLQTARNSEIQHQRSSRTQLQHDMDIISQRVGQEISGMKDDIKGMFNDHKMITREQQRSIDTSVQELNYKITVSLNSDGKSEIEGLRWILTRRAALTIAICAFMIIVFLKYASTRKAPEPKKPQEVEKPVVKEAATQTPIVRERGLKAKVPASEAHHGESLG